MSIQPQYYSKDIDNDQANTITSSYVYYVPERIYYSYNEGIYRYSKDDSVVDKSVTKQLLFKKKFKSNNIKNFNNNK